MRSQTSYPKQNLEVSFTKVLFSFKIFAENLTKIFLLSISQEDMFGHFVVYSTNRRKKLKVWEKKSACLSSTQSAFELLNTLENQVESLSNQWHLKIIRLLYIMYNVLQLNDYLRDIQLKSVMSAETSKANASDKSILHLAPQLIRLVVAPFAFSHRWKEHSQCFDSRLKQIHCNTSE